MQLCYRSRYWHQHGQSNFILLGQNFTNKLDHDCTQMLGSLIYVDKYDLGPMHISFLYVPMLGASLLGNAVLGPALLLKVGPKPAFLLAPFIGAACKVAQINFRGGTFDMFYLVRVVMFQTCTSLAVETLRPTVSISVGRLLQKYGTREVAGTVSAITRLQQTQGQAIAPLVSPPPRP